jgi:hypothetical protein
MITYDELIRRAPEWLYAQNRSLVDEMPAIVSQAHEQLINVIDHDLFRTVITGKTLDNTNLGTIDLSAESPRVLEIRGVRLRYRQSDDGWTPLLRRDLDNVDALRAQPPEPTSLLC